MSGNAFEIACEGCRHRIQVPCSRAGQLIDCPSCNKGFLVPHSAEADSDLKEHMALMEPQFIPVWRLLFMASSRLHHMVVHDETPDPDCRLIFTPTPATLFEVRTFCAYGLEELLEQRGHDDRVAGLLNFHMDDMTQAEFTPVLNVDDWDDLFAHRRYSYQARSEDIEGDEPQLGIVRQLRWLTNLLQLAVDSEPVPEPPIRLTGFFEHIDLEMHVVAAYRVVMPLFYGAMNSLLCECSNILEISPELCSELIDRGLLAAKEQESSGQP